MKTLRYMAIVYVCAMAMASCVTTTTDNSGAATTAVSEAADTIPFKVAENYFVRNDVDSVPTVVTSEAELEKYFGMAAVMGPDGRPTSIDFSQSSVVAVVLPETDIATDIIPRSMTRNADGVAMLDCHAERGEKQSFTTRPMLMVIVDKDIAPAVKVSID